MTSKKIGFIGVGLMGHGAAKNILEGGFSLTVLAHRNRAPVDDLLARGAEEATSAAKLAASVDILFTCVSDSTVMEQVVLGKGGVLEGGKSGLVLVDMTTSEPASTERLAATLAEKGIHPGRRAGHAYTEGGGRRAPQHHDRGGGRHP